MSTVQPEQVVNFFGRVLTFLFWAVVLGVGAYVVVTHSNDIVPFLLASLGALAGLVSTLPLPPEPWLLLALGVMVFINMRKLDRIGRQISAVATLIQVEVNEAAGNEDRKSELMREWTEVSDQKANRRRLWWDCAIVGALLLAWFVFAKH